MSIRLRLTLLHTTLVAGVLIAISVVVYQFVEQQQYDRIRTQLYARATTLRPSLNRVVSFENGAGADRRADQDGGGTGDTPSTTVEDTPNEADDDPDDNPSPGWTGPCAPEGYRLRVIELAGEAMHVDVRDRCGTVLALSSGLSSPLTLTHAQISAVSSGLRTELRLTMDDGEYLVVGTSLGDRREVSLAVFLAMPVEQVKDDLIGLRFALATIILATIGLTAGIGWWIARTAMEPVDQITRAAASITASADLKVRLPEPQQLDEIGRLSRTFNAMLSRLSEAFATQQRFVADASHELRTPLTAIRLELEEAMRHPEADPAVRTATLAGISAEMARLSRLVDGLLTLARTDAGEPMAMEAVALDEVVLQVYHQQRLVAGDVRLEIGDFEPVTIAGNRDRLTQLLINLVDNALTYTPAGGLVTIDLRHPRGAAILRVSDTGIGIPEESRGRVFERFYRVDQSRNRRTGGSGLGLAICREVAEAHGGTISVESEVGKGSTFTVTLPTGESTELGGNPRGDAPR